ncbi:MULTISPECIES: cytochrome c3 family protein [unclassified Candidatus Frackibacter]|uniref:cytochrome c3 family protein n=1 Tax=unclassified Candidatus Frackibacter TaxID=2648818 RepID=UPI0008901F48|nr:MULTISPECIES: cytochrome c3 family protein [unclassified Candidatus Frackibacter]SDC12454.1 doubled CXXCH domain-containing protein [Candidatus Frackibacter sp. WG11]SEM35861.1 doubled CXXCH domain-containing protein [Candidatus Frackibacter sp. WG12]SFL41055.1 doubled CXXCH domain-containing protein [Candidatus Frackibacter sp. WG13]
MKKWIVILTLSMLLAIILGGQVLAAQPKSIGHPLNGCSSCHVPHGAGGDRLWPFAPELQTQKGTELSSITALCYSCHDGTITNKGKHFFEKDGSTHPIGIKPSENVTIPEGFSLGADGKVTCATCHNPHSSSTESYLRVSNKNGKLCLSCHQNKG